MRSVGDELQADRLRDARDARLVREADRRSPGQRDGDDAAAERARLSWPVEPTVERLLDHAVHALGIAACGAVATLVAGDSSLLELTLAVALGSAIWGPLFLYRHRRLVPHGAVPAAPSAYRVTALPPRTRAQRTVGVAWALAAAAAFTGLLVLVPELAKHAVGLPGGEGAAALLLAGLAANWERRADRQLLTRDDDGDMRLYSRDRPAPDMPRSLAGLPPF
jgi:hypothetical protein